MANTPAISTPTSAAQPLAATRAELNDFQVLERLRDSATLRYFYLDGGVALHGKDGTPLPNDYVAITTFLGLRERGFIETKGDAEKVGGYPYYANNHKSQVYRVTEQGLTHLSQMGNESGG